MNVKFKQVKSINEFIDAIRIRVDVFIKEQSCKPGWEPDEDDKISEHFVAIVDNKIVATARVRNTVDKEFKIERMAVKKEYRNKGIGQGLIEYIIGYYKILNPKRIWIQSQVQAKKFYETCGFKTISKPYDLYGIEHIDMELI